MKSFLKYLLATVVGILISSVLLFFILMGVMVASVAKGEKPVNVKANSVLSIKLDKPITDRHPAMPWDLKRFRPDDRIGLNMILKNIEKAKNDPNISGIYLEAGYLLAGLGTTEEIRNALIDFKTSGKFIVAYSEVFTQKAYYLASVADKIYFNPSGFFQLTGLKLQTTHLKKTFEKLKIEPTVVKIGKYKGAGEMFEFDKMSDANREQLTRLIDVFWEEVASEICESRNMDKTRLDSVVNNLALQLPPDAVKYGLVDSLAYYTDVENVLKKLSNTAKDKDLHTIKLDKYMHSGKSKLKTSEDKIAIIYASGEIVNGEGDNRTIGGEKFAEEIRDARADSSIKAIVLRVNSPGGSAIASEIILDEIIHTKGVKPIVVSMGDLAASGGYYISCAGDSIIADNTTITGSIGVISVFFNAEGLYNWMGLSHDIAKTHEYADFMSTNRPAKPVEIAYWKNFTEYTYQNFLTQVSKGRGMEYEQVHEIAQGRVWGGIDATQTGLVDSYGGMNDAIKAAQKLANIEDEYTLVELPQQDDPLTQFLKELSGEEAIESFVQDLGLDTESLRNVGYMLQNQGVVARLPYTLDIE